MTRARAGHFAADFKRSMQEMKDEEAKVKRYGKHPVIWGLFAMLLGGHMTWRCVVFGGITHRGFWVSWQQVAPMLAFIWIGAISSLAFGIRRIFKEMMLSKTLDSKNTTIAMGEHRTTN